MTAQRVSISAPCGQLEGLLESGGDASGPVLVLCHPHPQYGGSMYDGVLDCAAQALGPHVRACLRFNFRGVGDSDGAWDAGAGEVDDVVAAANFLTDEYPDAPLWILGYSFGAAMAAHAAPRIGPARLILIAPPAGRMSLPAVAGECDVIYGDRDEFIDGEALRRWSRSNVRLHTIAGCNHFFSGFERELVTHLGALP